MFEALIVMCHITLREYCWNLTDEYGPYQTRVECEERLAIMNKDLKVILKENLGDQDYILEVLNSSCTFNPVVKDT